MDEIKILSDIKSELSILRKKVDKFTESKRIFKTQFNIELVKDVISKIDRKANEIFAKYEKNNTLNESELYELLGEIKKFSSIGILNYK